MAPAPALEERDPFIDLLRVACILVVVLGHWATTTVVWEPDRVLSVNALAEIPATRIITWLVQVMPLVFFAGGFANSVSRRRSGSYLGYLDGRLGRLLLPTGAFLAVWLALGIAAEALDPTSAGKARAAEVAALPLWFLGIYLVAVALAPAMEALHRRWGLWAAGGLAAAVGVVDLVSIGAGIEGVGGANYAFQWLFAHQLGFAYADGTLQRWGRKGAAALALGGLAALVLLTTVGGYPVSLVGVPGQERSNAQPPSLAMVALTLWLVGLALLLRPAALRWMGRPRVGRLVRRGHAVLLTAFLWHVTAITLGGGRGCGGPCAPPGCSGCCPSWRRSCGPSAASRPIRRGGRWPTTPWLRPPPGSACSPWRSGSWGSGRRDSSPSPPKPASTSSCSLSTRCRMSSTSCWAGRCSGHWGGAAGRPPVWPPPGRWCSWRWERCA
jgi:fucose 4-O-acetylase-like acetyltransferase